MAGNGRSLEFPFSHARSRMRPEMVDQHITAREGEQEGDGRDSKREIGVLNRLVKAPPVPDEGERDEAAAQAQPNEVEHIPERDACAKRSEEHTSELQSRPHLVCRLLLEKKKKRDILGLNLSMKRLMF